MGLGGEGMEEFTAWGVQGGTSELLVLGKVVPGIPGRERPHGWHDGDGCKARTNSLLRNHFLAWAPSSSAVCTIPITQPSWSMGGKVRLLPTRASSKWAGMAGIRDEASAFWREMIHPHAESSGADSGFVVAADVISEKELKSCFVSQIVSLKLSSLKKNLILSESGHSKPQTSNPGLLEAPGLVQSWRQARVAGGKHGGCPVPPAHGRVLGGRVSGPTRPSFAAGLSGGLGVDRERGDQREGGLSRGGICLVKAAIAIQECHKCAFQNSPFFQGCGGGSPLADTLGTSQVLSSGLALTTLGEQESGREGMRGCPACMGVPERFNNKAFLCQEAPSWDPPLVLPVCHAEKDQHCPF